MIEKHTLGESMEQYGSKNFHSLQRFGGFVASSHPLLLNL